MNNKNGIFNRIKSSVIERGFANAIVDESLGKAIKYFIIFMLIIGSIAMISFTYDVKVELGNLRQFVSEGPEFTFENGKLEVEGEMPLIKEEGSSIYIVDTTGEVSPDRLDSYNGGILITSNKIVIKRNAFEYKEYNLKDFDDYNLTKTNTINFIDKWTWAAVASIFVLGVLLLIIAKFANVLFVSIIGLIINALLRSKILYENILKLSIYAITLPTVVETIVDLPRISLDSFFSLQFLLFRKFFFLVYYGMVLYYLYRYFTEIREKNSDTDDMKVKDLAE